ncbi:ABC transporter permease subunit, partial [Pseudomonas sp. EA_15y_Pfl1_P102]|uniref:ABC transporter permease subunit n=1 Tax=Pseudomonas sp. EA_15y_Pfl1_P102 TaxID=3088685 RepID=UPI0030DCC845
GRLDVFYSAPPTVTGFYLIDTLIARDFEAFRSALSQLILPATTLAIFSLAPIARMTRASMLAVLSSEFVRTARASGLSPTDRVVTTGFANLSDGSRVTIGRDDQTPSADLAPRKRSRGPDAPKKDGQSGDGELRAKRKGGEGDQKGQ